MLLVLKSEHGVRFKRCRLPGVKIPNPSGVDSAQGPTKEDKRRARQISVGFGLDIENGGLLSPERTHIGPSVVFERGGLNLNSFSRISGLFAKIDF